MAKTGLPLVLGLSMIKTASTYYGPMRAASPRFMCMMGGGGFGAKRDTFRYTGKMRPGKQSPTRTVPNKIGKPDYAVDGRPKAASPLLPWQIEVKTAEDIAGMRVAGRVAREVRAA